MTDWVAAWKEGWVKLANESLADWWGRTHFKYYHRWVLNSDYVPRVFAKLLPVLRPDGTVFEVGAGSGAFTPHIARAVRSVTAVEPAREMSALLEARLAAEGLSNVRLVRTYVEDAPEEPHDVVFGSLCFYDMDIGAVVPKLAQIARERVVLVTTAGDEHPSAFAGLKNGCRDRYVCYSVLANFVHDLGYLPNIELVDVDGTFVYEDMEEFHEHWLPFASCGRAGLERYPGCFLEPRAGKLQLRCGFTTAVISFEPRIPKVAWFGDRHGHPPQASPPAPRGAEVVGAR